MPNVVSQFESNARRHPERTAVIDPSTDARYTYGDLRTRSVGVAAGLAERGIGAGDRVFLLSYNTPHFFEVMLAAFELGATVVPVNFRISARNVEYCVQDAAPDCIIFDGDLGTKLPALDDTPAYRIGTVGSDPDERVTEAWPFERLRRSSPDRSFSQGSDAPAIVFYTSGTTGRPKGVAQSHENLTRSAHSHVSDLSIRRDDVTITACPLATAAGLNTFVLPVLTQGGQVVVTPKFDPSTAGSLLSTHDVTILFAVPSVLEEMLTEDGITPAPNDLRYVLGGGEPVPGELKETYLRHGVPVYTVYGLTETTDGTHVEQLDGRPSTDPTCIGKPLTFVETKLIGPDGEEVPRGTPGELAIRGPLVTSGYRNLPDATADAWRNGWFHTGDIVRRGESGDLFVLGRTDDMIIVDGENVYPAEVERVLQSHPGVEASVVVESTRDDERMAAAVRPADDPPTRPEVDRFLADELAPFKIPSTIEFVSSLPRTAMGKVDRPGLAEELSE